MFDDLNRVERWIFDILSLALVVRPRDLTSELPRAAS